MVFDASHISDTRTINVHHTWYTEIIATFLDTWRAKIPQEWMFIRLGLPPAPVCQRFEGFVQSLGVLSTGTLCAMVSSSGIEGSGNWVKSFCMYIDAVFDSEDKTPTNAQAKRPSWADKAVMLWTFFPVGFWIVWFVLMVFSLPTVGVGYFFLIRVWLAFDGWCMRNRCFLVFETAFQREN